MDLKNMSESCKCGANLPAPTPASISTLILSDIEAVVHYEIHVHMSLLPRYHQTERGTRSVKASVDAKSPFP